MSAETDDFFYLDGFGELFWDGIYWNGQVQLPSWEKVDLTWLAAQGLGLEEDEDEDEFEALMNSGEVEELREAAKTDPEAAQLLRDMEELAEEEEEEPVPGWVNLSFAVAEPEDFEPEGDDIYAEPPHQPHPEQIAAAKYAREHDEAVQAVILADALELYQRIFPQLKKVTSAKFPKLTKPEELKEHLRLVGISPLMVAKDGFSYMAYYCACSWDLEDGLPYILHKDRIVLVGLAEDLEENTSELLADGGVKLEAPED